MTGSRTPCCLPTRIAAVLCWLALLTPTVHAQTNVNEVSVNVLPRPTAHGASETHHGYLAYRVALTNHSQTAEKRVTLQLPANSYRGSGDHLRSMSRSVVLAPGSSVTVTLLQPPLPMNGHGLAVNVDGVRNVFSMTMAEHVSLYGRHRGFPRSILASQSIDASMRETVRDQVGVAPGGRGSGFSSSGHNVGMFQSELPISQWSGQWLSYTRYDGVLLTAADLAAAPIDVMDALRRFTTAGGTLVVMGHWNPPADWRPHGQTSPDELSTYHSGLGAVMVIHNPTNYRQYAREITTQLTHSTEPWERNRSVEDANSHFPVVGDLKIPVKGLLTLMIVFAVLIGPVNLWVLSKAKRRMWLLWTVPTFSLLTCMAVWVYATAAEGWAGQSRTRTLTILDEQHMTAVTMGWAAFYAPVTPGGGLRYALDTEVTPQIGRSASFGITAEAADADEP